MRILVTGANGYLGQGIVREILNSGNEVIAVDFKTDLVDARAIQLQCSIFDIADPYAYFGQPDVLLHLAWKDGFIHNSSSHIDEFPNHCKFLKNMIDSGIKQVAVMGTMHEIGFYEGSIKESTPCNPLNLYGIAKSALRNVVEFYASHKTVKVQWLRGFYIVGNSLHGNSIFSKITAAAKDGQKKFPFTLGQNQYDFLNYEDFCKQVAAVVNQDEILGIINICSGKPEKLADRVERFILENKYDIKLDYGAFPDRPYDSKAVWGDNGKIVSILSK